MTNDDDLKDISVERLIELATNDKARAERAARKRQRAAIIASAKLRKIEKQIGIQLLCGVPECPYTGNARGPGGAFCSDHQELAMKGGN